MTSSGKKYVPPHRRLGDTSPPSGAISISGSAAGLSGRLSRVPQKSPGVHREKVLVEKDVERLCQAFRSVYCINLRRRQDRWDNFKSDLKARLGPRCQSFIDKIQRFDAVDGAQIMTRAEKEDGWDGQDFPILQWDATQNARYDRHIQAPMKKRMTPGEVGCAMSHVRLWRKLLSGRENETMLILEDDASFYFNGSSKHAGGRQVIFLDAFTALWKILPDDWDILYLGFSPRGEQIPIDIAHVHKRPPLKVFRPTYGFHTHAYAITAKAASTLLENGPVCGPLDVWLADNEWFGLQVYCAMGANEGYNREGRSLVGQLRVDNDSDIGMSGRAAGDTLPAEDL